jgi:uncharacterized membrane protein YphA (DoxX/SURF4 family)
MDVAGPIIPQLSKSGSVSFWLLQILSAATFFMSGFVKLSGNDERVQGKEA